MKQWLKPEFNFKGMYTRFERLPSTDTTWDTLRMTQMSFDFTEPHWRWWKPKRWQVLERLDKRYPWWDVPRVKVTRSDGKVVYHRAEWEATE